MAKKCIICDDPAEYKIKDSLDYYCKECAGEHFSDLSILIEVEEDAKRLQQFLHQRIDCMKLNETAELGEERREVDDLLAEDEAEEDLSSEEE